MGPLRAQIVARRRYECNQRNSRHDEIACRVVGTLWVSVGLLMVVAISIGNLASSVICTFCIVRPAAALRRRQYAYDLDVVDRVTRACATTRTLMRAVVLVLLFTIAWAAGREFRSAWAISFLGVGGGVVIIWIVWILFAVFTLGTIAASLKDISAMILPAKFRLTTSELIDQPF